MKILLLMYHSAGVGDMLRASASWRAIKDRFKSAELHLLFLSKDLGYVSERLISKHHLLSSSHVLDKRELSLRGFRKFFKKLDEVIEKVKPDMMIDLEPHELTGPVISLYLRIRHGIKTVGVNEFPLRGLFYTISSPPSRKVMRSYDYTDRFFTVLKALGIERNNIPIELEETEIALSFKKSFRKMFDIPEDKPLLGLNIGCGTPDALWRRPKLELIRKLMDPLQRATSSFLILTGAEFEKDINQAFLQHYTMPAVDLAGKTDILELPGLIRSCRLFISTDSGPYHMSVALRVPTLGLFVRNYSISAPHKHPWVENVVLEKEQDVDTAFMKGYMLFKSTLQNS